MTTEKRINALRNIQLKIVDVESDLTDEINKIEGKYATIFQSLYDQREKIVSGEREPSEEESKWEYTSSSSKAAEGEAEVNEKKSEPTQEELSGNGVPNFWLKAIKASQMCRDMVQSYDEPILKQLRDIKVKLNEGKPYGYTIEFHFNENEYFKNKVLTKYYELIFEKEKENPLIYNSNSLYKCTGSKIEWNEGKNVTVQSVKKKQTNKKTGDSREVTREEKRGSFFDLFETHTPDGVRPSFKDHTECGGDDENEDELNEVEQLFELDFELGQFLKDVLVPKALLYYTGEVEEEDDDGENEDDDDHKDDDENDDDNHDDDKDKEDAAPQRKKTKTK